MSKPEWQIIHDHFIDRIKSSKEDLSFFKNLIIRNPNDQRYSIFLSTIKLLESEIRTIRLQYKAVYGFYPKPSLL